MLGGGLDISGNCLNTIELCIHQCQIYPVNLSQPRGDMQITYLEKYNLEPMTKKVLRADIPFYLESDKELNNILLKKVIHEEIVDVCQSILKELNSRTFQLRDFISWERFIQGV